ncbi:Tubulin-folding cofactor A isoform C [Glycine soja]|uniref:Tubulin-specific chaperone A n=1 Tax=Glycine soja TaxID=3848 RepID=A0A445HTN2_GLYSO|nr:Tubulin-folding cofactor A isoform B [Glycine soja]RZB77049.1 Tubulin-folding cofactor A isoform C [Glycine soja]
MAGVGSSSYKGNDSILFCFHCKSKTPTFINGWQLRSGGLALLCQNCGIWVLRLKISISRKLQERLQALAINKRSVLISDLRGRASLWFRMATTVRSLKIKTSTCKRIVKELHSYEKEVEREAAKTADMKEKGADPYDLKQQENVLAESRMMIPDCRKRLEAALADLKGLLCCYIAAMVAP